MEIINNPAKFEQTYLSDLIYSIKLLNMSLEYKIAPKNNKTIIHGHTR